MFWPKTLTTLQSFLQMWSPDCNQWQQVPILEAELSFSIAWSDLAAAAIKHSPQRTGEIIIMVRILSPPPRIPGCPIPIPMPWSRSWPSAEIQNRESNSFCPFYAFLRSNAHRVACCVKNVATSCYADLGIEVTRMVLIWATRESFQSEIIRVDFYFWPLFFG